ncbi:alpha/beta hydrolase family protein [Paenibacillus tuaregi]|uniref:alpha/beta hydrolase family protein n=1 Tax=Paenibacillus tuaregi TaxID=1816681 RepID=UPI000837FEF8|nr:carboxylic ester hydrolase [Paenibacillus tuaregi]
MRLWEFVLILLVVGLSFMFIWRPRLIRSLRMYAAPLLGAAGIVQVTVEGCRWQMIPAYVGAVVLAACILWGKPEGTKRSRRIGAASLGSVLFLIYAALMTALPVLLPVFTFEKPTGSYPVGTTVYHWVDSQRADEYSSDPKARRELMVQIWYPASPNTAGPTEPYSRHVGAVTKGLENALSFPAWTLSHLGLVKTHAYDDAVLSNAEKRYPVLIFSHGMTGFRNQNTFQVEELVSHGYIVVGIDHAYDAAATVYPDGREVLLKPNNLTGFDQLDGHMPLWTGDVSFVLDQLELLNKKDTSGRFTGRLDLGRIGMFGHSFGGATAAQMLMKDSRIQAALNMDGTLYGEPMPETGLGKPYLQMSGAKSIDRAVFESSLDQAVAKSGRSRESYENSWNETVKRRTNALKGGGYSMTIPHTSHMSYTDFHLFSPLLQEKGEKPREVHHIVNEVSLAFFDRYVKGSSAISMSDLSKKYPEIGLTQTAGGK